MVFLARLAPTTHEWAFVAVQSARLLARGEVGRSEMLFKQRAGPALLRPKYLLFGQRKLAHNELTVLEEIWLACVSQIISNQLQGAILRRCKHIQTLCSMQADFVKIHSLTPEFKSDHSRLECQARADRPLMEFISRGAPACSDDAHRSS